MPANLDELDLRFSWNGDLLLDPSGDLQDNSEDTLLSLLDQLHIICASSLKDWEIYPNRGAGLDDFIGEANTRTLGDRVHDRIRLSIIAAGLVVSEDLEIRVVPIHIHKILVLVRIAAIPTTFNQLAEGEYLQTALVFDSSEQQVFFLDQTPVLTST